MSNQWAVVGGGLLGMTLAYKLAQQGHAVTLFEAASSLGGLASAWTIDDVVWDRHYHVTLYSDQVLRGLLRELELDHELIWNQTQTGFYHDGRLHPFTTPLDFLRFPLLNPIEKARLATTILRAAHLKEWQPLRSQSIEEWLTSLCGSAVFNKIWRPLLKAKLGEDYKVTSATFIWATIQRMYAARAAGMKQELFGYLPGGYAHMLDRFGQALGQRGVAIRLNASVSRIERCAQGRLTVHSAGTEPMCFERVVVTAPAPVAARLCPELNGREAESLESVAYLGILCASVLLTRPLSSFYITNILDSTIPFTGLIEMSALVDPANFRGRHLLYIPRYLRSDHPDFARAEAELQQETLCALRKMHPSLSQKDVVAYRMSRARYVFPRPGISQTPAAPLRESSIAGLSFVNSAQIENGTLNANETVNLAFTEAQRLHASIQ